jgi:pimeloyl-ACP methyl ester carboxylesterase
VEASVNYLETRPDVDKKHLGLIGHSEGGMIAPMVAARRKDVSFIVMWGASEAGGAKINTEQNAIALRKAGIDSIAVDAFTRLHEQILALFASAASREDLDQKIIPVFDEWKKVQPQKTLDALYVHGDSILEKRIFEIYNGLYDLPWMRYFITYNSEKDLSKVKCSVLAVNGEKDMQVNAVENLGIIKEVLTKSGNKDFETVAIPNLNHLLQTAKTGDVSEYESIEETMSPVAMKIICDWIKLHTE